MNSNIVKIGKALKWRGVYDNSKKYYAENIITCYGGVFRCNVSVAQGIPPYELNEEGLPTVQNSETWTCLVDTTWIIEWVLAFKKFKNEVIARFDTAEKHIQEHCEILEEHQKNLENLYTAVSELNKKDQEHDESITSLSDTIKQVDNKADENAEDIDNLNTKLNEYSLTLNLLSMQNQQLNERITNEVNTLNQTIEIQNDVIEENSEEIIKLKNQIVELQEKLELISKYNCCFSSGVWDNELYWNNESYWNNGDDSSDSGSEDDDNTEITQTEISVISYTEETAKLEVSGTVTNYIEDSGTLAIVDENNTYDESTGKLNIDGISL